jgi:hypothetical protein
MSEKLEILQMIKEGAITPEQGVRLIEALDRAESPDAAPRARAAQGGSPEEPKWLHIEIKTRHGSKYKSLAPIRIPFSIIRLFFRFLPANTFPGRDFNPEALLDLLKSGKPLEMSDEEGGRAIRIFAE